MRRSNLKVVGMICMLIIGFTNCKHEKKPRGFNLQRFDIVSSHLDSVVQGLNDSCNVKRAFADGEVLIMVLRIWDSKPEFCFTTAKKEDVTKLYTSMDYWRIVGYIEHNNVDFIVLSTESNKTDFELEFYKYIHPTNDTKCFDYIYFPDDMYAIMSDGRPYPPPFFDPHIDYFVYINNKIIPKKIE